MKRFAIAALVIVALAPAAAAAEPLRVSTFGWKTYHAVSGEYAFKYPGTLGLSIPKGRTCTGGNCRAIEEVMLSRLDVSGGKSAIRTMQFSIQRGLNVARLTIPQMYERLAHRPLNSSESVISVGGRLAVHRGPRVHGATVTTVGGKTVSTSEGLVADNETYVALDATDVLNISCSSGSADWAELCSAVVSTLTLAK